MASWKVFKEVLRKSWEDPFGPMKEIAEKGTRGEAILAALASPVGLGLKVAKELWERPGRMAEVAKRGGYSMRAPEGFGFYDPREPLEAAVDRMFLSFNPQCLLRII